MRKQKTLSIIVLIICIVTVVGGGFVVYRMKHDSSASPQNSTKTAKATPTATTPKTVQVELPGGTSIDALIEDYDAPTSIWTVVSKDFPLADQQYRPSDLALTTLPARADKSTDERSVRAVIVPDLTALFTAAKNAGNDIMIASGFRSYEQQQTYFSNYSRVYGEEAATKFSARPGQSEHQIGLALDIAYTDRSCYLEICFGDTAAGKWLALHAHEYGFILRYPADKTEITKYQYEPWHFRYVGKPLANALYTTGLTLDEARPYLQAALTQLKAQHKV